MQEPRFDVHSQPPSELVAALEARSTCFSTPCGKGCMVWRQWGSGRPVVLFHGGHGSWTHWIRNIEALAATYRVIAADLPGLGDSATPPLLHTPDTLSDIVVTGLVSVLAPDELPDIVGFSFGGMIGGHTAVKLGRRVRSLTLVGSGGLGIPSRGALDMRGWRHLTDPAAREAVHRHNLGVLMLADPRTVDALAVHLQSTNTVRGRMDSRRLSWLGTLPGVLPRLQAPLRGIWGENDLGIRGRVEVYAERLAAMQAGATLTIIPGAGHWVQFEAAGEFNRVLLKLLAPVPDGASSPRG
ncbi:MAG TPA: alpha/beta fold hydrolase [Xanthobacteraceae bacterium]|nr:alpha/beta fold hydrolase [Xanthobacteraceae bacterium]